MAVADNLLCSKKVVLSVFKYTDIRRWKTLDFKFSLFYANKNKWSLLLSLWEFRSWGIPNICLCINNLSYLRRLLLSTLMCSAKTCLTLTEWIFGIPQRKHLQSDIIAFNVQIRYWFVSLSLSPFSLHLSMCLSFIYHPLAKLSLY